MKRVGGKYGNKVLRRPVESPPELWVLVDHAMRVLAPRLLEASAPAEAKELRELKKIGSAEDTYKQRLLIRNIRTRLAKQGLVETKAFDLLYIAMQAWWNPLMFQEYYQECVTELA